jgi:hypothetical protein
MKTRPRKSSCSVGLVWLPTLAIACAPGIVLAGEMDPTGASARERFFEQNVRPLLVEKCYSCHATKKQKGGLRLDSIEAILKGGESGPAVVPGKPDESLLVAAINYAGPEMPPDGKLAPEKVAVLTRWVASGATWPAGDRGRKPRPSRRMQAKPGSVQPVAFCGHCRRFAKACLRRFPTRGMVPCRSGHEIQSTALC